MKEYYLKPCTCGGEAKIWNYSFMRMMQVKCENCGEHAKGVKYEHYTDEDREKAIKAAARQWNQASRSEEIKYLKELAEKHGYILTGTGHWIHENDDRWDWLVCSECGYGEDGEVKYGEGTLYCPHCGAKMEDQS